MTVSTIRNIGTLEEWEAFGIARRRAYVSQLQLAALTGISQPYISGWERKGEALTRDQVELLWSTLDSLGSQVQA